MGAALLFCVWLGLSVLNFFALSRIISKAGFSSWWVLCPITPLALVAILFLMVYVDAHTASLEPGSLGTTIAGFVTVEYLIGITSLGNWVLFLVFAFVRWPVESATMGNRRGFTPRGPSAPLGFAAPPSGPRVVPPSVGAIDPRVPAAVPMTSAPDAQPSPSDDDPLVEPRAVAVLTPEPLPATIFCSWCGEERASDSHAIHHCGPTDRPATFCMRCGSRFEGASTCPSCGTPATELSKTSRRR